MLLLTHDQIISWKSQSISLPEIDFLSNEKSWSKDIIQYGKLDETCIEFIYNEVLEEIYCRFDLRNLTKEKLNLVIAYVKVNNAMFFAEGNLYMPEERSLIHFFKQSEAFEYCKNPSDFIKSLA